MSVKEKINSLREEIEYMIEDILSKEYYVVNTTKPSKYFEFACQQIIRDFLILHIPNIEYFEFIPSEYPDIKFKVDGLLYAIDVKTAKYDKGPAFDLAYLSTYEEDNLNYEAEWVISIAYDPSLPVRDSLKSCYINELYEIVSVKSDGTLICGGDEIKLRPLKWSKIKHQDYIVSSREELLKLVRKTIAIKCNTKKYSDKIVEQKSKGVKKKFGHNRQNIRNEDKQLLSLMKHIRKYIDKHNLDIRDIEKLFSIA